MKNLRPLSFLLLLLCPFLYTCKKPGPWYFWKGTIYKGTSDEPLEHTHVILETMTRDWFRMRADIEILGETKTNRAGEFTLMYKQITKPGDEYGDSTLTLRKSGGSSWNSDIITGVPRNTNFTKVMAETDHARVLLDLNFTALPLPDSIYFVTAQPVQNEYLQSSYLSCNTHSPTYYYAYPVTGISQQILTKFLWRSTWDNRVTYSTEIAYATSIARLDSLLCLGDTSTSASKITVNPKGFPVVDTLSIEIQ